MAWRVVAQTISGLRLMVCLLSFTLPLVVHAQPTAPPSSATDTSLYFSEAVRRITALEAVNAEHRLTHIEAVEENNAVLIKAICGGMGLLLGEKVLQRLGLDKLLGNSSNGNGGAPKV